jgi:Domain of unknown function (DUF4304)
MHAAPTEPSGSSAYDLTVSTPNGVHEAFGQFGRKAGLERKGSVWFRRSDTVVAVVGLQKSQYGRSYYVNVGFWLRELGDNRFPKEERCHIRVRLGGLATDQRERINELLNLDYELPETVRVSELVALLNDVLLPAIERGANIDGLRAMRADGTFRAAGVSGPAADVLSAPAR